MELVLIESLFARADYNSCEVTHEEVAVDVDCDCIVLVCLQRSCHLTPASLLFFHKEQSLLFGVCSNFVASFGTL